jgi:hypothetical protein
MRLVRRSSDYLRRLLSRLSEPASPSEPRWWIALATALMLCLALAFAATWPAAPRPQQHSYPQPSKNKIEQPEQNKGVADTSRKPSESIPTASSPSVKSVPAQDNKQAPNHANDDGTSNIVIGLGSVWTFAKSKWHELLLTVFTGLLAIFTYLLWNATAGLWEAAQEQSRDVKASVVASQQSAKAAEAAAKTADQALKTTQRAYIAVEPGGIRPYKKKRDNAPIGDREQLVGHFSINNVGNLPAREVSWFARIICDERRKREPFPIAW